MKMSNGTNCPTTSTSGYYVKDLQRKSFTDTSKGFEQLSKSQANGVWRCLQIINTTLCQLQNGSRSNLIVKYLAHKRQYPPNQAVTLIKECFLDENPNLNGSIARVHKKFQLPDNYVYLANQNSYLNKIHIGLLSYNIRNVLQVEQLFRPQIICSHKFHTTSSFCGKQLPFIPFEPPKEALGVTFMPDLSDVDREKIKKMAYIDLKSFLTSHDIPFTKVKSKRKSSDHGVFGTSLEALVQKDIKKNHLSVNSLKVPAIFSLIAKYIEEKGLETEGIFRVPGSAERVASLRADLENFYVNPYYSIDVPNVSIHDVASIFKAFLRELPTYLVSSDRLEIFPDISNLPMKSQIKATNLFILSMNEEYRDTLLIFLKLMNSILAKKEVNKMNDSNLATCLTPKIFLCPRQSSHDLELKKLEEQFGYFRLLTHYNRKLFFVPHKLVHQLRQQYESGAISKPKKRFKSAIKGKKNIISPGELKSIVEVEIEIHAPERKQESGFLTIDSKTTAKDVVEMYNSDLKHMPIALRNKLVGMVKREEDKPIDYLYEVGGNIGERCLDPDTIVIEVFRTNPKAEWMIKTRRGR
ncbi:Rho GTPase-activating protein 18 [Bulinus truncatus]|nr:Rho GTPase-activating protein 18 [Bulinus truncatus]